MQRDIAILIPAFNASATIAETLDSIQRQEAGLDRAWAVIVADDRSSDDTVIAAESAWKSSVPLQVIRNGVNRGERATVNEAALALPMAVAWIFILHADDLAKPEWLRKMLDTIDQSDALVASVTASYDVLHEDGRLEKGECAGDGQSAIIRGEPKAIADTLRRGCWWKISSCAIRMSAFRRLEGFAPDMPQLGDLDFIIRLMGQGWSIAYLPQCLSIYRQTNQSVSSKSFLIHRDVREWLRILENYGGLLPRRDLFLRYQWLASVLLRRVGRAVLLGRWPRVWTGLAMLPVVLAGSIRAAIGSRRMLAR